MLVMQVMWILVGVQLGICLKYLENLCHGRVDYRHQYMEAEYMAASAAAQKAMWLNRILQQLGFRAPRPTKIYFQIRRSKHIYNTIELMIF